MCFGNQAAQVCNLFDIVLALVLIYPCYESLLVLLVHMQYKVYGNSAGQQLGRNYWSQYNYKC